MSKVTVFEIKSLMDNSSVKQSDRDNLGKTIYNLKRAGVEGLLTEVSELLSEKEKKLFKNAWVENEMRRAPQITRIDAEQAFNHKDEM